MSTEPPSKPGKWLRMALSRLSGQSKPHRTGTVWHFLNEVPREVENHAIAHCRSLGCDCESTVESSERFDNTLVFNVRHQVNCRLSLVNAARYN